MQKATAETSAFISLCLSPASSDRPLLVEGRNLAKSWGHLLRSGSIGDCVHRIAARSNGIILDTATVGRQEGTTDKG